VEVVEPAGEDDEAVDAEEEVEWGMGGSAGRGRGIGIGGGVDEGGGGEEGERGEKEVEGDELGFEVDEDSVGQAQGTYGGRHEFGEAGGEVEGEVGGHLGAADVPAGELFDVAEVGFGDEAVLQGFAEVGGLPAVGEHEHAAEDVFDEAVGGEAADVVDGVAPADPARAEVPAGADAVADDVHAQPVDGAGLVEGVVGGRVVEELGWADHACFVVPDDVGGHGAQPVPLGNHVGVEAGDVFGSAAGEGVGDAHGVVEVASFVAHGADAGLDAGRVMQVGRAETLLVLDPVPERGTGAVVGDDDAESGLGVIDVQRGSCRVLDDVHLFVADGDDDID